MELLHSALPLGSARALADDSAAGSAAALAEGASLLRFAFPLPRGAGPLRAAEPEALLSLKIAGSLRYLPSSPNAARESFFSSLGLGPGRIVATELHHSRRVLFIEGPASPSSPAYELDASLFPGPEFGDGGPDGAPGWDGLLIGAGGSAELVPAVTVADCMPIWILDRSSGAYGVLHSGWKGTGILEAAVKGLAELYGSPPSGISLILGPAVGPCCYEVPQERAAYFRDRFGEGAVSDSEGGCRLDLRAANIALALRLGLGALLSVDACTSCEPSLGSYRREGKAGFTRMVAACGRF